MLRYYYTPNESMFTSCFCINSHKLRIRHCFLDIVPKIIRHTQDCPGVWTALSCCIYIKIPHQIQQPLESIYSSGNKTTSTLPWYVHNSCPLDHPNALGGAYLARLLPSHPVQYVSILHSY